METEKSQYFKDKRAFTFENWERFLIADSLKPQITKLEKEITKIQNHPRNDGQATFIEMIRERRRMIELINEMITGLSN